MSKDLSVIFSLFWGQILRMFSFECRQVARLKKKGKSFFKYSFVMSIRRTLLRFVHLSKRKYSRHQHYGFVMLGAPGVGKGTFSKLLAKKFDANVITSGDLLRRAAKEAKDKDRGRYLQQCIASGQLVPDHIVLPMIIDQLRDQTKSFILDGFPRTLHQAERIYAEYHFDLAIYLTLPDDVLTEKLLGRRVCNECGRTFNVASICKGDIIMPSMKPVKDGICDDCGSPLGIREDDTIEVVEQRLKLFHEIMTPILDFYKEKGTLLEFEVKTGIDDTLRLIQDINNSLERNR
ncbi:hypothetical protein RFI_20350 [Reticulomyxa filosa]|uniref:Adenylate kinase active site lid domain-containing protein n=1 Tax=Reticulomyxa filosa TaxID=46433 RepID=X6MTL2_RETFI|nr:hypothetical protein RFI_20350 [Reticulomyxa filosa]|eukprot:ETO16986.1 hypothetical protein RFI_20350 [Reticulomyxa filosa]